MNFKRNNWKEIEGGGIETFIRFTEVHITFFTVNHFRTTIGLGDEKLPFFLDYLFSYLDWQPKKGIIINYHEKPHRGDLGHYYETDENKHSISIRRPIEGWKRTNVNLMFHTMHIIAHEMVHAWQSEKGRFSRDGKNCLWMGEVWQDEDNSWSNRPWEIEAVEISNKIMSSFVEMIKNRYGQNGG